MCVLMCGFIIVCVYVCVVLPFYVCVCVYVCDTVSACAYVNS